jgi:hypothetical protein
MGVSVPGPLSDAEINELVRGWLAGDVLFSPEVETQSCLPLVFLPLVFGMLGGWSEVDLKRVVLVGRMRDAGPRSINGYPSFMACRVILWDDFRRVWWRAGYAQAAQDAILEG